MRHRILRNKLSRNSETRGALIKNTIRSFFKAAGSINITLVKAKVIRINIEKLITSAKKSLNNVTDSLVTRRKLISYLGPDLVNKVLEVAAGFQNRNGGYTRIIKAGFRKGDNAPLAYLQLVK